MNRNQIKTTIFSSGVQKKVTKIEKIGASSKNLKLTFYKKTETGIQSEIVKIQVSSVRGRGRGGGLHSKVAGD